MDVYDLILYGLIFLVVGGTTLSIMFLLILNKKYKYKVQIREVANGRKLISEDRAKEAYDDKGVKYLRLRRAPKQRKFMPFPAENAVEIDSKGKKHVIVYLTESGDYQYATDDVQESKLKSIPSEQKVMLASQIRRAQERKPKSWTEHISTITNGMVLVIIVVSILVFGTDFAASVYEPMEKLSANIVKATDNMVTFIETQERIESDIQLIKSQLDINQPTQGGAPN